jgi:hypothetical protein
MLNIPQNIFVGQLVNTSQGPVITTQVYDEKTLTYLDVYEWEVFNGARLIAPLPFGMFAEIERMNMNKSKLRLRVAPGFIETPANPQFTPVTEKAENYGKYLSDALITRQVVPPTFVLPRIANDDWDMRLEPIDASHSMFVKIIALTPPVYGSETRRDLYIPVPFTEEIVTVDEAAIGIEAADPSVEYTPVDVFHTLKRTGIVPIEAMTEYNLSFPSRFAFSPPLPLVLKSIKAIWNEQFSIGTQDTSSYDYSSGLSGSVSTSIPDSASSSAAVSAELAIEFEDFASNNLYTQTHIFYMPPPINIAAILAKLATYYPGGVSVWPVFYPRSETIVTTGQSVSVRANCQVSLYHSWSPTSYTEGWSKSTSDDYSIGLNNGTIQLPPCIHGVIDITDSAPHVIGVSATANMGITSSNGTAVSATITKSGTATGKIHPVSLLPTSDPTEIPTSGYFLMDVDVKPYDYGWFQVRVEIFNADALSP